MRNILPNALYSLTISLLLCATASAEQSDFHPILGGYRSCDELRQQIETEDFPDLIREDIANFEWTYKDLVKALKYCNLPVLPEMYYK